jgi:hypothetical protein
MPELPLLPNIAEIELLCVPLRPLWLTLSDLLIFLFSAPPRLRGEILVFPDHQITRSRAITRSF